MFILVWNVNLISFNPLVATFKKLLLLMSKEKGRKLKLRLILLPNSLNRKTRNKKIILKKKKLIERNNKQEINTQ